MFRSDMKEAKSGTVQVDDVGSQVMEILVKFWYTGQLDESWSDPGVIHELTYAAGKYTMNDLLEFLNNTLGSDKIHCDIRLLDLARKLDLKRAAAMITYTLVKKTATVKTDDELMVLFGCPCLNMGGKASKQLPEGPRQKSEDSA